MLTLRKRIFIIIGVVSGLIIAVLLSYFLFKQKDIITKSGTNNNTNNVDINNSNVSGSNGDQPTGPVEIKPVDMSVYAKQVAKIFVERFATYSNQNRNEHIDDVLSMCTPVMTNWLEKQRKDFVQEYEGVVTTVAASRILEIDEKAALVEVDTQQQINSTTESKIVQKTGKVELAKIDGDWKVNGFYWNK